MAEARRARPTCPICGRQAVEALRPFCSRRCAEVDLGPWLTERYRIPANPDEAEDESSVEPT